jgi:polyhydroxybutyrate depolymerase
MHHHHRLASFAAVLSALALLAVLTSCSSSPDTSATDLDPATTGVPTTVAAADVAAAPSSGCSAAAIAPGDTQLDLAAGTEAAWYLRHVPPSYSPTDPMPLVLDLHGYSEGAKIHVLQTQLTAFGDIHGFITVTPQIERSPARWDTTLGNSDLAFLGSVLDQAEATLCIDQNRVFVTGLSNGAFMTSPASSPTASPPPHRWPASATSTAATRPARCR